MRNPPAVRLALAALCLGGLSFLASGETKPAKESFGFSGMEMYKLDWDTHNLRLADVNGDGLTDIVVVNNARARIECLLAAPENRRRREGPGGRNRRTRSRTRSPTTRASKAGPT